MFSAGEVLDGYQIVRKIGEGGFGTVWLVRSVAVGDLRALKLIPAAKPASVQKELDALLRYRLAASYLRSPFLMPIEHINRTAAGLFYVMPLGDGDGVGQPRPDDEAWQPWTLANLIEYHRQHKTWFVSTEIVAIMRSVSEGLQALSEAGLVHRDVKPDNILFLSGQACLADISLLGEDSQAITRRGTPGYSAPSWYAEKGGHPDMFGAAATLFTVLTGNPPDKMGRAAFRWPPQGEKSLSPSEQSEWSRLRRVMERALNEEPTERFLTFSDFAKSLVEVQYPPLPEMPQRSSTPKTSSVTPTGSDPKAEGCLKQGIIGGVIFIVLLFILVQHGCSASSAGVDSDLWVDIEKLLSHL